MNWNKVSAISEIIGSIAILATLIYLVVEINQNTRALQANSRDNVLEADTKFLYTIVEHPSIWLDYHNPNMTNEEKVRLYHLLAVLSRIRERDWFQYQSGALNEEDWKTYITSYLSTLSNTQTRKWWNYMSEHGVFDESFRAFVDDALKDYPIESLEESGVINVFD